MIKLKKIINSAIHLIFRIINKSKLGVLISESILNSAMGITRAITHNDTQLVFSVPNAVNAFRVSSFSTKEPETLEWIDSLAENSVLWDIGANIGLYSCYAAKSKGINVYAFEPSVFNLELLARNIFLNQMADRITIIPLPLSNSIKRSTLNMTSTEWGGALSTFGENYGDDGKELKKIFEYSILGLSIDDAISKFNIPLPNYIKIDVDGIEHLILSGGKEVLNKVEEVAIEVNEDFEEQTTKVKDYLTNAGLIFRQKKHSEMFNANSRFGNTYNQVWIRPK